MIQVLIFIFSLFSFLQWHGLSKSEQSKYYDMAKRERQIHSQLYPGWTARDNYAKHKKKRRKRDKIRTDSNAEGSTVAHCGTNLLIVKKFSQI